MPVRNPQEIKARMRLKAHELKWRRDHQEPVELIAPIVPVDWTPLPGRDGLPSPQAIAYACPADILFFGGAGGGGKSDLLLGLAGQAHRKSIIFRREFPQMAELRERARTLYTPYGRFNGHEQVWHFADSRTVEFGAVQIERFVQKYQGRPHDFCVGRGTPVRMSDGTYTPIEDICCGDLVATLEGPRQVTRILPIQEKAAVLATFSVGGRIVVQQIQGSNHEVLTTSGWVSHDTLHAPHQTCACAPRQSLVGYKCERSSLWRHDIAASGLAATALGLQQTQARVGSRTDHPQSEGSCVVGLSLDQGTGSEASEYQPSRAEQHFLMSDLPWQQRPSRELSGLGSVPNSVSAYDADDGLPWSLRLNYLDGYSSCTHRHDGRVHPSPMVALVCPQQLTDAEQQIPRYFLGGTQGRTHEYSHHRCEYPHPYTKERRSTADLLVPCEVSFAPLGEMELFDLTVESANHYITGTAGIVNKNCAFDEVTHFLESQFRFLIGWMRTTVPGQRWRVVATGNPPMDAEGEWIIQYWGPWLDPTHPYPAVPGELRWYATVDGKDVERQDGTPFEHKGEWLTPMSRTFIPSRVEDNPYLMASGYKTVLQNLPEPLRSKMLHGDFSAGMEDNPWQVIPTAWVDAAMARWTEHKPDLPLSALGVDIARGGLDKTVLVKRYGPWFAPLEKYPGTSTPDGPSVAGLIVLAHSAQAEIHVDIIGVGGSGYDYTREVKGNLVIPMNGAEKSLARDRSGQLHFRNKRAEWHWKMREALDPVHGDDLALPPDRELRADLIAPRWKLTAQGIQIEEKDEIKIRLGRSPDSGEAVIYANAIDTRRRWLPVDG